MRDNIRVNISTTAAIKLERLSPVPYMQPKHKRNSSDVSKSSLPSVTNQVPKMTAPLKSVLKTPAGKQSAFLFRQSEAKSASPPVPKRPKKGVSFAGL